MSDNLRSLPVFEANKTVIRASHLNYIATQLQQLGIDINDVGELLADHIANHPAGGNTHEHINIDVLNAITQQKVTSWDGKVDKSKYDADIKTLTDKVTALEKLVDTILNPPLPHFMGIINHKPQADIVLDDIKTLESNKVIKPQTVYNHADTGLGAIGSKALVVAFPKSFGTITSIVDNSGTDISGSYPVIEKVFNINGKNVAYYVCSTKNASLFNNTVVFKFNIA